MTGVLAEETAEQIRSAVKHALQSAPVPAPAALAAFMRLLEVLQSSSDAAVFPIDATLSTQEAAALIGVSRMTVVRLVDKGELVSQGGAVHRRITASEVARYQAESEARRRTAIAELSDEINEDTPPDQVIATR